MKYLFILLFCAHAADDTRDQWNAALYNQERHRQFFIEHADDMARFKLGRTQHRQIGHLFFIEPDNYGTVLNQYAYLRKREGVHLVVKGHWNFEMDQTVRFLPNVKVLAGYSYGPDEAHYFEEDRALMSVHCQIFKSWEY